MSVQEYMVRMEAYRLRREDENERMHYYIWQSERVVKASNKKGVYYIKEFKNFYKHPEDDENKQEIFDELHRRRNNLQKLREKGGN